MHVTIRPAVLDDAVTMQGIERRSAQQYRSVGLDFVADDEPDTVEALHDYARAGRAWVAVDADGVAIGYVLMLTVDGHGHIEQISVEPEAQNQGVGRAMLAAIRAWALNRAMPALTLTTYDHVPWNRPLYEHWGFEVLPLDELGPELAAIRAAETAHGLDPADRVCMQLTIA